jgi:hypothetical protein
MRLRKLRSSWPCPGIRTLQLSSVISSTSAVLVSLNYRRAAIWTGFSWTEVKFLRWNYYHFITKNSVSKTNFGCLLGLWCFITLYQLLIYFVDWVLLRFTLSLLRYFFFTKCRTERIYGRSSAYVCPSVCFISWYCSMKTVLFWGLNWKLLSKLNYLILTLYTLLYVS